MKTVKNASAQRTQYSSSKNKLNTSKISNKSKTINENQSNIPTEIYIFTVIRNKKFKVYCSSGTQNLLWLFNYTLHLYETNYAFKSGLVFGYIDEEGLLVDQGFNEKTIRKTFLNNQEVKLLLKEEYDVKFEDQKKNKKNLFKVKSRSNSPIKNKQN